MAKIKQNSKKNVNKPQKINKTKSLHIHNYSSDINRIKNSQDNDILPNDINDNKTPYFIYYLPSNNKPNVAFNKNANIYNFNDITNIYEEMKKYILTRHDNHEEFETFNFLLNNVINFDFKTKCFIYTDLITMYININPDIELNIYKIVANNDDILNFFLSICNNLQYSINDPDSKVVIIQIPKLCNTIVNAHIKYLFYFLNGIYDQSINEAETMNIIEKISTTISELNDNLSKFCNFIDDETKDKIFQLTNNFIDFNFSDFLFSEKAEKNDTILCNLIKNVNIFKREEEIYNLTTTYIENHTDNQQALNNICTALTENINLFNNQQNIENLIKNLIMHRNNIKQYIKNKQNTEVENLLYII